MHSSRPAGLAAFWWATVFAGFHVYWYCGGRFGFGDASDPLPSNRSAAGMTYAAVVVGMFLVGLAVPWAVMRPWGRRVPRWMIAGCLWAGTALLLLRGASGWLDDVLRITGLSHGGLTGMSDEEVTGDAHPTAYTVWSGVGIDTYFVLGAWCYGWLTLRHWRSSWRCPAGASVPRTTALDR